MGDKPTKEELDRIIDAWIVYFSAADYSPEKKQSQWASELQTGWVLDSQPEIIWEFINIAYKREMPAIAFACLASGPLEDLIADHGRQYIDQIEALARQDPMFNFLLGGVWKRGMPDEIWERVQAIQNEVW